MKNYYVIKTSAWLSVSDTWYLYKGNPKRSKSGSCYSAGTPQLKYARKFKSREDAARVIKEFTPNIFKGNEEIIEIID